MKILIMGNNDHKGGLIVHYEYLAKFLKTRNYEVVCININDHGLKMFDYNKVQEYVIPYKPKNLVNKIFKIYQLLKCSFRVRKIKPDVFISTGLGYGYNFIGKSLKSGTYKILQEVIFDAKLDKLRKKMISNFDAIAVQTESMISNYKINVSKEVPVNYLPCFTREMKPPTDIINKEVGNLRIAYFGRLAHNKGLVEFIDHTKDIFKEDNIIFDIFGGGIEYNSIKDFISLNLLEDKVSLKGFYSDEDFPNLMNSYDALILPSTYNEGLPLVILECMFYGKPIFASNMGSIPEIAKRNEAVFLSDFEEQSQKQNFKEFIEKVKRNYFDPKNILEIYNNYYSNKCFENIWIEMLKSPSKYFN
jgi:glycosyltransferase involved in cell wall biosynthesis